jgi:mono/diheme cytochrome c family protein
MKRLFALALMIVLGSCASTMNSHRMKAAQRKMLDTRKLQQAGQWDEALAMAERMHSSVSKSVTSAPRQKSAAGPMVDLQPLLAAWESGPYAELKSALQEKDAKRSGAAFVSLRQQCVSCHAVLGKTQIVVSEIP